MLSALPLPADKEFDIPVRRILIRQATNEIKAHPDIYRYLPSNANFDYLCKRSKETYPMSFQVVRFKVTDELYETVITNLDASVFPPWELKILYAMRWGIETAFRELKYAVGLTAFHAKKREYIIQEIFARLIMYNFSEMIIAQVSSHWLTEL